MATDPPASWSCSIYRQQINSGGLRMDLSILALAQHVDGVARDHEDTLNAIQCGRYRFGLIEINGQDRNTQTTCFVGGTSSRYYLRGRIGSQVWNDGSTYLARGSQYQDLWFNVCHM
jgi:hypothetical protein